MPNIIMQPRNRSQTMKSRSFDFFSLCLHTAGIQQALVRRVCNNNSQQNSENILLDQKA